MARRWLLLTQLCIALALAASAALYVHYLDPVDSSFCGVDSGCEVVRRSSLSYLFGSRYVSLPLVGLVAYAALFALSIVGATHLGERLSERFGVHPLVALFALSGLGASVGLALFAYQWLALGHLCWLCVIVDAAAVATAVAAFFVARAVRLGERTGSPLRPWASAGLAALSVLGPVVWHALKPPPPIPPAIAALHQPGRINVVEIVDFQCPHCRNLHKTLKPLLAEYGEQVHFVRLHRPLENHPMAEPAARAAICAEAQGKGEAMADRLFSMELSHAGILAAGRELELDGLAFASCLQAPATTQVLEQHAAVLDPEDFKGLPTTYVGTRVIIGARPEATFRAAFEAARKAPPLGVTGPVYVAALGLLLGALLWVGRQRGPTPRHDPASVLD